MKRIRQFFFVLLVIAASGFQQAVAQQMPSIPVDPNVRIGKLSNGLTYYIRKNALPEKRAFFYIAQKVGSIQEEPQQRGLAHFLEHMCFNGTKHFPDNSLVSYLEKIGVKFGENLNAYTSIEETVYNIDNVPVTTPNAIDSCLYILHDWSNDLTLDPKEIDKERGVINEEWRLRRTAMQRIQEAMLPVVMKGSKYEDCMPIGTMDIVMHFKPQVLRDYYEKWYRPDLQGVVVVGDINVDEMEAKIKKIFSDIPAQPNAAKRIYYPVPDNAEPIVFIGQDKELTNSSAVIFIKHEAVPDSLKNSLAYLAKDYLVSMACNMLNARYNEMLQKPNPPFTSAEAFDGEFFVAKTKDALGCGAGLRENEIDKGFGAMYRELLRAKEFGFTQSEYTRARADMLRSMESLYNERDKQESNTYVDKYVRNFLDNEPIPSIEQRYTIMNQLAPNIPVEAINQVFAQMVKDSDIVVMYTAPEKAGLKLPTKEELLDVMSKVRAEKLTAYVDKVSNEPLIAVKPKAGKVLSVKKNPLMGTTEMTLSNGAKVVFKKTDFKKDEITVNAVSKGGSSLFPDNDVVDIKQLSEVAGLGGIGKFSTVDLQKVLAGKMASVSASVGLTTESVNASCSPKDAETMMQLIYLTFTSPRKDLDAFNSYKTRLKADLKNQAMEPMTALQDTLMKAVYGNNPRAARMKENMVDKIDYDKILSMYKNRFCDASDFTFFFVGNADPDTLKPLIEQYIASLPAIHRTETYKKMMYMRKGVYSNEFLKKQQTPTSNIFMMVSGAEPYTLKNVLLSSMLGQILDIVYTKTIREDAGAAYSVSSSGSISSYPTPLSSLQIFFPTAPEKKALAMKLTKEGIEGIIKNGPDVKDLNKVKEFMLKNHAERLKQNSYWMGVLVEKWDTGLDTSKGYEDMVKSITVKDIQAFAAGLYRQNNFITVSMTSLADKK
jgi:zinc protease